MRFTPPDPTAPIGDFLNDPIASHPEVAVVLALLVLGTLYVVFRTIRR